MLNLTRIIPAIAAAKASVITGLCVAALCFPLGYCKGESAAKARADAERSLANTKALKVDAVAKDNAAASRVKDALTVKENEDALVDAISETPDEKPDALRVKLGCARLRAQGEDISRLPACRRPGG